MTATAASLFCCCGDACGECGQSSYAFSWSGSLTLGAVCDYTNCLGCLDMVPIGGYVGSMAVSVSTVLTARSGPVCIYRGTQTFTDTTTLCDYDPEECEEGLPTTVTTEIEVTIELRFESIFAGWICEMWFRRYVDGSNHGHISCDFAGSALMGYIKFCPESGPGLGDCPPTETYVECGTSTCTPAFDAGVGASDLTSCGGAMRIDEWTIGTVTIS